MIIAKDIKKKYNDQEVLRGIDLKIDKNEFGRIYGGLKETNKSMIFASIQSLRNCYNEFKHNFFDYIIVDEFHHSMSDKIIAGMSRDEIQVMQKGLKNLYQFLEDLK